jgi:hypothetical protein
MENQKKLTIAPAGWGQVAADLLRECFTVSGALEMVGAQVESGRALLFTVDDGGGIVAAFVLRVDGTEGVIVAATGGLDLMPELLPLMEARFSGCSAVRIHTARAGLAKLLVARNGYGGQEIVLRKTL